MSGCPNLCAFAGRAMSSPSSGGDLVCVRDVNLLHWLDVVSGLRKMRVLTTGMLLCSSSVTL